MKLGWKLLLDLSIIGAIIAVIIIWIEMFPYRLWPLFLIACLLILLSKRAKWRRDVDRSKAKRVAAPDADSFIPEEDEKGNHDHQ